MDSLIAGAIAGLSVDLALYPLDTLKTRLQTNQIRALSSGKWYAGVSCCLLMSVPSSAVFFYTYETCRLDMNVALAAAVGESIAGLVRTPLEIIKQRMQADIKRTRCNNIQIIRGYGAMLGRDVPFALIQYPLFEYLRERRKLPPAISGAIAGVTAACLTHPLDVVKTRIMVDDGIVLWTWRVLWDDVYKGKGSILVSGLRERVLMIGVGGFVYFGAYGAAKSMLASLGNQHLFIN